MSEMWHYTTCVTDTAPDAECDCVISNLADEIAALEAERDELRKLLFVDRDEWRRFRVHGDTVLALEAVTAERDRLREALEQVKRRSQEWRARDKSHICRYRELLEGVNATARAALEAGGDDE